MTLNPLTWWHNCLKQTAINSPTESEMTGSEPLNMTGNGERPLPPRHCQVGDPLNFCLRLWGYWKKLISSRPLLPAPLMQRVLNDLVLSEVLKSQIPTDYYSANTWSGIIMAGVNSVDIQQADTTEWTLVNVMQSNAEVDNMFVKLEMFSFLEKEIC